MGRGTDKTRSTQPATSWATHGLVSLLHEAPSGCGEFDRLTMNTMIALMHPTLSFALCVHVVRQYSRISPE